MDISDAKSLFNHIFGPGEVRVFWGPARVNLIGEHTDHQGGYVFPCAISLRSICLVRPRADGKIRLAASDIPGMVEVDLSDLSLYRNIPWGNYQIGVLFIMQRLGYSMTGMDMLFDETVPYGSGLSSSAAIEVATAMAVATLSSEKTGISVDKVKIAQIAQAAENEYVGMNCGIMDPFASAMGRKDHAILLRCQDLSFEYVPVHLKEHGYSLLICNTKKPRSLVTSAYNQRIIECREAFESMRTIADIDCLAELTPDRFEKFKYRIPNPIALRRAQHVVYENARTVAACELLKMDDIAAFGRLVTESHLSLRDLFEVTGPELDAMFEAALQQEGVAGTRMIGAGFGGCAIAIVRDASVQAFIENVGKEYKEATGITAEFYIAEIADGAREIV